MTLTDLPGHRGGRTVLVIGDALLDGWLDGTPRTLCREAPVPALTVDRTGYACGGVAAVIIGDYRSGTLDANVADLLADRRSAIPLFVVDAHDPHPWAALRPDLVTPSFDEAAAMLDAVPVPAQRERADFVTAHAGALLAASGAKVLAVTLDRA